MVGPRTPHGDIQNTQAGHVLDPEKKRRKDRPRQSWQSDVTVNVREVGVTWENLSEVEASRAVVLLLSHVKGLRSLR